MKSPSTPALLICLTLALCACQEEKKPAAEESLPVPVAKGDEVVFPPNSPKFKQLVVGTARQGQIIAKHFYGRITTNEDVTVRIFTPVFGRVASVAVDIGQQVHAGDVLMRLLSPDMGQAQSDAHKAASDLNTKTRIYFRTKDLMEHGAASANDLDGALNDMQQAQAEKKRADVRLEQLYGGPAETLDGTYPLKTPIDGTIVDRNVNVGQEVRPDQQLANAPNFFSPMFTITDPNNLWVMVDVTERELPDLHPGDSLIIRSSSFPGKKFPGKILKIGDMLDPTIRTAKVRASVENIGGLLKPETYVNVDVLGGNSQAGAEVPSKAVLFIDGKNYVFVEKTPGTYTRQEVKVGDDHDERASLTKGIKVGDHVVEDGALYLQAIIDNADSD